jgi:hypothetical protein
VQQAGKDLFAGSGLAGNENRTLDFGRTFNVPRDFAYRASLA